MGVAALYAYSQKQTPATTVVYSQAVSEIQQGRVKSIDTTVGGNSATLTLTDNSKQQTTFSSPDNFDKLVTEYNAAHAD